MKIQSYFPIAIITAIFFLSSIGLEHASGQENETKMTDEKEEKSLTNEFWSNFFLVITGIGSGSVAVAILEWYLSCRTKNREEYVDISKERINKITTNQPLLVNLLGYSRAFARQLLPEEHKNNRHLFSPVHVNSIVDTHRCLYYLCGMLQCYDNLNNLGGLQLDDLEAEKIVFDFGKKTVGKITNRFGYKSKFIPIRLIEKDGKIIDYIKFQDRIEKEQYKETNLILEWMLIMSYEDRLELSKNALYFGELLLFELNHMFHLYYKSDPNPFLNLCKDLLDLLRKDYPHYYDRIMKFRF